jgi:hypothetical protein
MDAQTLLAKPKETPTVVAKVTTISPLVKVSTQTKKTSIALRKTFENGIYQRKTQLSVLNRYKKRLDSIQKENDNKYRKKQKQKPKGITLPKFKGTFFTAGASDDFLKSLGALAAFNSVDKLMQGDFLGALSPGMVAAAALLGPGLLGMAGDAFFNKGPKVPRGTTTSTDTQKRYRNRYGDKAADRRFGKPTTQQGSNVVEGTTKGGRAAKALGRFGASIIPGVGAVVGAADAAFRAQAGDQTGAAIAGTGAALDAFAAGSAATGIGLPLAGLASIASFALDLTNLTRDLLGVSANEEKKNKDKLKEKTKEQKQLASPESNLTFATTLVSYEKALVKFETFAKQFTPGKNAEEQKAFDQQNAARVENLGAGSTPISEAGYEFTNNISQYLTGDPNSPAYDYSHGTTSNYHDHLAFKDRSTAERAYNFLKGKGIQVTEFKGYDAVGTHSAGSSHYSGLAFDVPGAQWGGRGAIGQTEYQGSSKVRAFMNDFFQLEKSRSNNQGNNQGAIIKGPDTGYFALLHGTEAIVPIDNYHTRSGGDPLVNISPEIINNITARSKTYGTQSASLPPEVIQVPMPIMPPQIQYVSGGSGSLNIQSDADKKLLKMLYYSALG